MLVETIEDLAGRACHGGWMLRAHYVDARDITYIIWIKRHICDPMHRSKSKAGLVAHDTCQPNMRKEVLLAS